MNLTAGRKWTTVLFNPFVYVAGGRALGLGIGAMLAAGVAGFAGNAHFDGVLDLHVGRPASFAPILAEGFIDWLALALVLLVLGKIVSKTAFRVIDVLGTQALARWPMLILVGITLPPAFQRYNHVLLEQIARNPLQPPPVSSDAIYFFGAAFLMLPLVIWMIALMYNAYGISCNVKGARAIATFVVGLVLAEIVSKLVIIQILR